MITILEWLKNKIFKQGIGIAEKTLEARRDRWGGNVILLYITGNTEIATCFTFITLY